MASPIRVLEGEHRSSCPDCDRVLTFKGCRGMLAHHGQLAGLCLQPNQQEYRGARGPIKIQAHQSPGAVRARPQALEQAQGGPSTDIICQNEPGPTGLGRPALSWLWRCFWDSSLARIDEGQGQILGHLFHISNDANNLLLITCCTCVIPNSGHKLLLPLLH